MKLKPHGLHGGEDGISFSWLFIHTLNTGIPFILQSPFQGRIFLDWPCLDVLRQSGVRSLFTYSPSISMILWCGEISSNDSFGVKIHTNMFEVLQLLHKDEENVRNKSEHLFIIDGIYFLTWCGMRHTIFCCTWEGTLLDTLCLIHKLSSHGIFLL